MRYALKTVWQQQPRQQSNIGFFYPVRPPSFGSNIEHSLDKMKKENVRWCEEKRCQITLLWVWMKTWRVLLHNFLILMFIYRSLLIKFHSIPKNEVRGLGKWNPIGWQICTVAVYSWYIANNFVIGFYCRCL
jgi:hypothetical protein